MTKHCIKVAYTVGAVFAAFEFYNSITKAGELSKKLQRLRDSSGDTMTQITRNWKQNYLFSDLLKYEGAAKEVFNIALDLQLILTTVFRGPEEEYEVIWHLHTLNKSFKNKLTKSLQLILFHDIATISTLLHL